MEHQCISIVTSYFRTESDLKKLKNVMNNHINSDCITDQIKTMNLDNEKFNYCLEKSKEIISNNKSLYNRHSER